MLLLLVLLVEAICSLISNGRVVRSYCLTEGESLLPVPKPSEIAWVLDEVARLQSG
jgi:hypothetical protein